MSGSILASMPATQLARPQGPLREKALHVLLRQTTHRPLNSSVLGLPYRIPNINHKKELLRSLWVGRFPYTAFYGSNRGPRRMYRAEVAGLLILTRALMPHGFMFSSSRAIRGSGFFALGVYGE